jgi:23S rRNA (cytosine1962-C5)-methyltransferase
MKIYLKPGKDKPPRSGNPWIFSGAVAKVSGSPDERNLCAVYDDKNEPLGVGYYNEKSAICVRMLKNVFDPPRRRSGKKVLSKISSSGGLSSDTPPPRTPLTFTADDLYKRIERAAAQRNSAGILTDGTDSCRLVNSEGDFLPGLTVDRFGSGVCVQIGTAGMEVWRDVIIDAIGRVLSPSFIYERSDTESRKREGLSDSEGLISGSIPDPLIIYENGVKYYANLRSGQKTGFFFDQRESRALARRYSAGRDVCDCFSYSGGFALAAALGGAASVRAVDTSADAGRQLSENARLNGVNIEFTESDVFAYLRKPQPPADLLILDPPKFARHKGEVEKASRGYKDINLAAMKALNSGGLLFTFSCSGAVDPYLFRQIIFAAASDARRQIQVLHTLTAGPDHPVNIAHKEGEYLKGLVLRVVE